MHSIAWSSRTRCLFKFGCGLDYFYYRHETQAWQHDATLTALITAFNRICGNIATGILYYVYLILLYRLQLYIGAPHCWFLWRLFGKHWIIDLHCSLATQRFTIQTLERHSSQGLLLRFGTFIFCVTLDAKDLQLWVHG